MGMIDRSARDELALAIRRLSAGLLTNDRYELMAPDLSEDPAIRSIHFNGAWYLYSDKNEETVTLQPGEREMIARWILFLKSDFEYAWPVYRHKKTWGGLMETLMNVFSFDATLPAQFRFGSEAYRSYGDFEVWPFISREIYNEALKCPPYLNGKARTV